MPMRSYEADALVARFPEELSSTPAPFFGVNIYDVNEANLAEFQRCSRPILERIIQVPGCSIFFRGMSDYGSRKRVIAIARYDEPVDGEEYRRLFNDDPEFAQIWGAFCETVEAYEWFTTRELS